MIKFEYATTGECFSCNEFVPINHYEYCEGCFEQLEENDPDYYKEIEAQQ